MSVVWLDTVLFHNNTYQPFMQHSYKLVVNYMFDTLPNYNKMGFCYLLTYSVWHVISIFTICYRNTINDVTFCWNHLFENQLACSFEWCIFWVWSKRRRAKATVCKHVAKNWYRGFEHICDLPVYLNPHFLYSSYILVLSHIFSTPFVFDYYTNLIYHMPGLLQYWLLIFMLPCLFNIFYF